MHVNKIKMRETVVSYAFGTGFDFLCDFCSSSYGDGICHEFLQLHHDGFHFCRFGQLCSDV